jgi:hypothetical protein
LAVKPLRWSAHALKSLRERENPSEEVERTLAKPEAVIESRFPRTFLMRRYFDARLGQQMLLRVLIEETPNERVVITIYSTSKIERYMKKAEL